MSGKPKTEKNSKVREAIGIRVARVQVYGSTWTGGTSEAVLYNLEDHLGNSSFTLTETGGEYSREEYFPFGETAFGCYVRKRYRFCGKERDEESGLYYYGARYYAPWCCRFVSVDPLAGKYPFYTPYQYAGNKPINFIDLDGLEEADKISVGKSQRNNQKHGTRQLESKVGSGDFYKGAKTGVGFELKEKTSEKPDVNPDTIRKNYIEEQKNLARVPLDLKRISSVGGIAE